MTALPPQTLTILESRLIDLAGKACISDSDNRKKGNPQKVDEFRCAELEQYLDEALFLLELIGVRIFKKDIHRSGKRVGQAVSLKPHLTVPLAQDAGTSAKPSLPNDALGPCAFAKTALTNLLKAGYIFNEEQMATFSSVEGSRAYTKRNLPLFWVLKNGESRVTCEKAVRERYWKEEFISGDYRFLMYSQWYDDPHKGATKDDLMRWYATL